MSAVRNLANQNRTIICTIHQPSPAVYFLFDKLLLLGDGRVTYFGPTKEVVKYFSLSPYEFKYIQGTNPADYVIAVAGAFIPASSGQKVTSGDLATHFSKTEMSRVFMDSIDTMLSMDAIAVKHQSAEETSAPDSEYASSTSNQIKTLVERLLMKTYMQPRTTIAGIVR
jgi:ABC-type multidrug transport system ATPase subunit